MQILAGIEQIKEKSSILTFRGAQSSSIIATTLMIYRNNKAMLATEQLLEEMHIQWHLAGGKLREVKDSDNEDEVGLVASTKKGGKQSGGGDKPRRENPNKDETCNHCNLDQAS
jgi:hypothetical protein